MPASRLGATVLGLTLTTLTLTTGCLDHLLEAPYVLASGVGKDASAMSPTTSQGMLAAGPHGVFEIDGSGRVLPIHQQAATVAVGHAAWTAIVDAGGITFGTITDGSWTASAHLPQTGVTTAQAWCDDQLLLLVDGALLLVKPGDSAARRWADAPPGAVDLTLAPGSACAEALVLTPERLLAVSPQGQRVLVAGLAAARTVALDRHQQPWLVHGEPPVLARAAEGQVTTVARHVGDVVDMHFGTGELLHPENAYLLTREGRVDYVRVPAGAL